MDTVRSGETALWRAVVLQALLDATFGRHGRSHLKTVRVAAGPARRSEAAAARRWLLGNGRDFRMVCDLAGLDPVRVRARALKAVSEISEEHLIKFLEPRRTSCEQLPDRPHQCLQHDLVPS